MQRISARASFEGEFHLSGDKSITHRAVMFNAGAVGEATVQNALISEDTLCTCDCMRALGASVEIDGSTIYIKGVPEFRSGANLNCGNSATTMRLLTGFLSGKRLSATLYGDESLSSRPMQRVAEPLRALGAKVKTTDGKPPISLSPAQLRGNDIPLKISSAQVKSAVLLAGISADGTTSVTESIKSRDHTERLLLSMGADLQIQDNTIHVKKSSLHTTNVEVPSDISSAAYFMALGALKGKTLCKNVCVNPTRTGIFTAFDRLGVRYTIQNERLCGGEEIADVLVEKSPLQAIEIAPADIPSMIDELPLIALLCAYADGESRIYGAQELRFKESDRITTTARLINALGGDCQEQADGFIIRGKEKLTGGNIYSYDDHRIAMSGAVGLIASQKGGELYGGDCCAISFPDFFQKLSE